LTLIRFGWIDADDWMPQAAATGQMAGLPRTVYAGKLISIAGAYRRHTPIVLLSGVGERVAAQFGERDIRTVGDLIDFDGELPRALERIRADNAAYLADCVDRD
jgi:hypothetical protein